MQSAFADAARRCDEAVVRVFGGDKDDLPVYNPLTGADYEIDGVLELPDAEQEGESPEAMRFLTRLSSFAAAPAKGDRLTVEGVEYRVLVIHPEGEGSVRLVLGKT